MRFVHIQKFNDSYRLLLWCALVCEMRQPQIVFIHQPPTVNTPHTIQLSL